jgi:hypothetical protein
VLVVLATAVLLRDYLTIRTRDAAWQRAQAAVQTGDDAAVLKALGEYFEAPPTRARTSQESQAVELYTGTVGRWMLSRGIGPLNTSEQDLLRRYRRQIVDRAPSGEVTQ